ncbi:hypothetical protein [Parendozoicomonas haliclonae]|uniref:Uncharacterized protein n=1 Tax=Parendozoicomonas haliclonae TaxID=1960125 RepID=A0A1X7AGW0_9GAMM|nr:hypothetical protein [Parendozoicomonas haliclonae]SMA40701.1 hypothetical protein EHSB41UT_01227 [Parendozoicomonas haliclonae]
MDDNTVRKLALVITANCLRDTPVENVAANRPLNEAELQTLRKSMSDRLYTFLLYLLNKPASEYSALMDELSKHYPADWPMPELDQALTKGVGNTPPPTNGVTL